MKGINSTIFAVDFDGTCVTHDYPKIGHDIGAVSILKKLTDAGHYIILWTMRSDNNEFITKEGIVENTGLTDAVNWFKENGIPLYGIQRNPTQNTWTQSPKCYAHVYIDDAALGCPLIYPENERPYVDWKKVEEILINKGYIK